MSHQEQFAENIADNIINGNKMTARGQLSQCSPAGVLLAAEALGRRMPSLAAAHETMKRVLKGDD